MASRIQLDQQGMSGTINRVRQVKEEYDNAIATLESIINSLDSVWVGDSQRAMKARYEEKKATFKLFSQEIGEYISGMEKTLQVLPGTDKDVANAINRMNIR